MVSGLIDRPWKKVLAAAVVAGGVWYATQFENCNGRVSNFLKDPNTIVDVHEPNPESTSAPAPQKYTKEEALNLLVNVSGKPNGKKADGSPNYSGEVSCKELQKQEFLRRTGDSPITSTEVDCLNVLVNVSGKSSGKNPDGSANYDGEVSCKDLQQAEFERRRNDTPVDGKKGGQPVYQVSGHEPGTGENLASRLIDVHVEIDQCDAEKTTLGLDRRELYVAAHLALQRSGIPSPKNRQRTIEETVKDLAKVPVKYGCEDPAPCPKVPAQSTPADETTSYNPGSNATTVATTVNLTESVSAATQIDCSKSGGSGVYSVEQLCAPIADCENKAYDACSGVEGIIDTNKDGNTCDELYAAWQSAKQQTEVAVGKCDQETVDRHTACYDSIRAVVYGSRKFEELNNIVSGIGSQCLGTDNPWGKNVAGVLDTITVAAKAQMNSDDAAEYSYVLAQAAHIITNHTGVGKGDDPVEAYR